MGLSRNKVAVPEGAAGSPPFYGDFRPVSAGRCVPREADSPSCLGSLVWKRSGLLVRLPVVGGSRVVWACFWVPGPSPQVFPGAVPRPMAGWPSLCAGVVAWWWVRWWFENWIVDASGSHWPVFGRGWCVLLFFRRTSALVAVVWFRLIVL